MAAVSRVDSLLSITSPPPYSEASVILTPDTDPGDYGISPDFVTVSVCQWKNRCKKIPLHAMQYCAKHKCTVQGCGKPKDTRVFGLKRSICLEHQCQCCRSPRLITIEYKDGTVKNIRTAFCKSHKCHVLACPYGKHRDSIWCSEKHKCKDTFCTERTTNDTAQQCPKHTCATPGCFQPSKVDGGHCVQHACQDCSKPRARGQTGPGTTEVELTWCSWHKCQAASCAQRRQTNDKIFCPAHTCEVQDCGSGRKAQASGGQPFRYCGTHCCATSGCGTVVHGTSTRCTEHKCKACNEPRLVCATGTGEQRLADWCKSHRCGWAGKPCFLQRCEGSLACKTHCCSAGSCKDVVKVVAGALSPFCANHTCEEVGCSQQRLARTTNPTKFCTTHVCPSPECASSRVWLQGSTRVLATWCPSHKCQGKCNAHVKKGGRFCTQHSCQHAKVCTAQRPQDAQRQFCRAHECERSGCIKPTSDHSPYCVPHTCSYGRCPTKVDQEVAFCGRHACRIKGCKDKVSALSDGQSTRLYCLRHGCDAQSKQCMEPKIVAGCYCNKHTCSAKDCCAIKVANSNVCEKHVCTFTGVVCRDIVAKDRRFCSKHCCWVKGCVNAIKVVSGSSPSNLCVDHACTFPAATGQANCTTARVSNATFCKVHKCTINGCYAKSKLEKGGLCASHACNWRSAGTICATRRWELVADAGGEYCMAHTCGETGCPRARLGQDHAGGDGGGNGDYCRQHTCSIQGCTLQTDSGTSFCTQHKCGMARCRLVRLTDGEFCRNHSAQSKKIGQ